jgi:hypothetical protein
MMVVSTRHLRRTACAGRQNTDDGQGLSRFSEFSGAASELVDVGKWRWKRWKCCGHAVIDALGASPAIP